MHPQPEISGEQGTSQGINSSLIDGTLCGIGNWQWTEEGSRLLGDSCRRGTFIVTCQALKSRMANEIEPI
jgi:hypothetical protein